MTYVISRAKIRRCGGQIDTSLAWRREAAGGHFVWQATSSYRMDRSRVRAFAGRREEISNTLRIGLGQLSQIVMNQEQFVANPHHGCLGGVTARRAISELDALY